MLKPRYFFRRSAGPGWALAGDAGHHKEFVVGLGISDALHDARTLADAALRGEGLERWWRRRDVERVEMAFWSRELGRAERVTPLQRLIPALLARPEVSGRFGEVIDGRRSPYELIPAGQAVGPFLRALGRGELALVRATLGSERRRARARAELRRRERLLAATPPRAAAAPRRSPSGSRARAATR